MSSPFMRYASPVSSMHGAPYLLRTIPLQPEFAGHFAAGVLAAIEVHTPRAPKGERSTRFFRVLALAGAGATVGRRMKNEKGGSFRRTDEAVLKP